MIDAKVYTINVTNQRKSGAVQVTISQPKQKTIQVTIEVNETKAVKVYPGTDSLVVTALDCRDGEVITVKSEKNPDKKETKRKPPYDFDFTLNIPAMFSKTEVSKAEASEDNIVIIDDEGGQG